MIETQGLTKRYGGVLALNNLNMKVNSGDIYGFIGPNGAGKSTTFKILATILRPDSGTASVNGAPITDGDAIRSAIGYMPDTFGVYDDMTVFQYLDFFGAAYYIPPDVRERRVNEILELTDLSDKRDALTMALSRGMKQRLGVARVLVHDPKVLILDEPASGLDPRARYELRTLMKELAGMGKTILISSHILTELAEICGRVGIIEKGSLVFEGSREELNQKIASRADIIVDTLPEHAERAEQALNTADFVVWVRRENARLTLRVKDDFDAFERIPALLIEKKCAVRRFHPEELTLEQAFMILTKGKLA